MANTLVREPLQRSICCPCGKGDVHARGLCASCYTLKRQDAAYFGGLREKVLSRDGHRCRVCHAPSSGRRTIVVHHRKPGLSRLQWMIALCPACHARVSRTLVARKLMQPFILKLWREQHPEGQEQLSFVFMPKPPQPATEIPQPELYERTPNA